MKTLIEVVVLVGHATVGRCLPWRVGTQEARWPRRATTRFAGRWTQ